MITPGLRRTFYIVDGSSWTYHIKTENMIRNVIRNVIRNMIRNMIRNIR